MTKRNRWIALFVVFGVMVPIFLSGCATRTEVKEKETTIEELRRENEDRSEQISELQQEVTERDETIREYEQEIERLEQELANQQEENERLRGQIEQLEDDLETARAERQDVREQLTDSEQVRAELREEIDQLKSELNVRIEELREENETLEQDLSQVKEASTRQEGSNVVITLDSRILFDLGDHRLKNESRTTLDKIADVLSGYENRPIAVEGHTDTVAVKAGSQFPSNWHLSAARAVSVVEYLTERKSLSPSRMRAVGYGEYDPLKPNTTEENRRLNRRVEIVLYPPKLEKKTVEPGSSPED